MSPRKQKRGGLTVDVTKGDAAALSTPSPSHAAFAPALPRVRPAAPKALERATPALTRAGPVVPHAVECEHSGPGAASRTNTVAKSAAPKVLTSESFGSGTAKRKRTTPNKDGGRKSKKSKGAAGLAVDVGCQEVECFASHTTRKKPDSARLMALTEVVEQMLIEWVQDENRPATETKTNSVGPDDGGLAALRRAQKTWLAAAEKPKQPTKPTTPGASAPKRTAGSSTVTAADSSLSQDIDAQKMVPGEVSLGLQGQKPTSDFCTPDRPPPEMLMAADPPAVVPATVVSTC